MSQDFWLSQWNPFNSSKVLMWYKHLEGCSKDNYLIPVSVDVDPSNRCNYFCAHCLPKGEKITTIKGRDKTVESIKIGDELVSWNEKESKLEPTKVKQIFTRKVDNYLEFKLSDGKTLRVTEEHPIYINNQWIKAKDANINDKLLVITQGDKVSLRMKQYNPMFNKETVKQVIKTNRKNGTYQKFKEMVSQPKSQEQIEKIKKTKIKNGDFKKISERMKKNNPMFNEETRKKVSKTSKKLRQLGLWPKYVISDGGRKAHSDKMKKNNPMFKRKNVLKRLKKIDYVEVLKKTNSTSGKRGINKLEDAAYALVDKKVIKKVYYNKDCKYTVNLYNGSKNFRIPDFVCFDCDNNIIGVIEVGVATNPNLKWNKSEETLKIMTQDYANEGLKCLFLEMNEIYKQKEQTTQKITNFVNSLPNCPHSVSITNKVFISKKTTVYNFECTPHNNFFTNYILVHNCNAAGIIKSSNSDMSEQHLLNLADFLKNWGADTPEGNPASACVSGGGEPLINTATPAFLERMFENGLENGVITNGSLISKHNIDILTKCCRWIGISMDAGTHKTYNKIKFQDNTLSDTMFKHVCNNIKKLAEKIDEYGVKNDLCFKFLLTPDNYNEIYAAVKLAKSLGVKDFHLRPVGYQNIVGTKDFKVKYTPKMLTLIEKQMKAAMKLSDKNFRVFGITHKFNPDFSIKKKFSRCWAIPLIPTFSADGNVYMCFDMRGRKDTILCKHDPDITEIAKFWNTEAHKKMVKDININKCPRCFEGKTQVLTPSGNKNIQDLNIGDSVLTQSNKELPIIRIYLNDYKGEIAEIRPKNTNLSIKTTLNHKFKVLETNKCTFKARKNTICYGKPCSIAKESSICAHPSCKNPSVNYKITEKEVKNLTTNDYLLQSKYKITEKNEWTKMTPDMTWLLGLYIAEGIYSEPTIAKGGGGYKNNRPKKGDKCGFYVSFYLGGHEKDLINKTINIVKQSFGAKAHKLYERNNSTTISFNNKKLNYWCQKFNKLSYNKEIPLDAIKGLTNESLIALIQGYLDGDGHNNVFVTVSKKLIDSLSLACSKLDILLGIRQLPKRHTVMGRDIKNEHIQYEGKLLTTSSGYKNIMSNHNKQTKGYFYETDTYFAIPIKSINKNPFDDKVYNLEIKDEHNYIVNNISVSNCTFTAYNEIVETVIQKDSMCRLFP